MQGIIQIDVDLSNVIIDQSKAEECLQILESCDGLDRIEECSAAVIGKVELGGCCDVVQICSPGMYCSSPSAFDVGTCKAYSGDNEICTEFSCASGFYCDETCKPIKKAREACVDQKNCQAGLVCFEGKCQERFSAGDPCSVVNGQDPCSDGAFLLRCIFEEGKDTGVCTGLVTEAGAACSASFGNSTNQFCAPGYRLYCDAQTNTCKKTHSEGEACDAMDNCSLLDNLYCDIQAEAESQKTCKKRGQLGDDCNWFGCGFVFSCDPNTSKCAGPSTCGDSD
jgi:hypothetical protein